MDIRKIFNDFNKLRVLVVGDVMLDSYIWGSVDRISPEAPVPVVTVKKRDYRLGGAANVALNVKALGAEPVLCALVGEDDAAVRIKECLGKEGISGDGLVKSADRPTTVKTRVMASHQHVVRVDEESDRPASATEEEQLLEKVKALLPTADVVIFEDYDKGALTETTITQTVAWARQSGIPTVVDPKKRNFFAYKHVSLFKPNLKELREGLKTDVDGGKEQEVKNAVGKLKEMLQADGVMLTLSEQGVYIDYQGTQKKLPAHKREIADVSGAGDTVVAIAALCVALKREPTEIAALANLGGGLVCQHVGVVPINKGELQREAILLLR
ncbi:MAG: bifunctional heptose 7-phosphate kinase/heptose 1-phosphate adenyltransferase [Bacteroidota bacterium]